MSTTNSITRAIILFEDLQTCSHPQDRSLLRWCYCQMYHHPPTQQMKLHSETHVSGRLGMSGVDPLDMPRTLYRASERKHSQ